MSGLTAVAVGLVGLAVGFAAGFTVQRARLCTFGALEDALIGGNWRRLRAFGVSLAIAIAGTQLLILAGGFDPTATTYVPGRVALAGIIAGSIMFGLGMALVGTCAFGSLVRLGTGDLRSLVTLLIFGLAAYAVLRGALAGFRVGTVEAVAVSMPRDTPGSYGSLAAVWLGPSVATALVIGIVVVLLALAARDARLRASPRLLTAAVTLGLGVVAGWAATAVFVDPFAEGVRVQSLTFVAPVARGLAAVMLSEGSLIDFGVLSVIGVPVGAGTAALLSREYRWEAFDDHREMRRHLAGAVLMGLGGVLAGGCTIGQGLTGGSLIAVSWPASLVGMALGARLGIAMLLEGSIVAWLRAVARPGHGGRFPAE